MEAQKRKLDSADYDDRKVIRKMRKRSYETKVEAKQLWNDLRKTDTDKQKLAEVSKTMFNLIQSKAYTLVFAHDTSRVVQTFMKVATLEHRAIIFDELKDHIILMMKSKFAKFVVKKLMKYGSKEQKLEILSSLKGSVSALLKHKEASEVLEYIYNDFATVSQRNAMEEEFYGPTFVLNKNENTKNLQQFLTEFPDKKDQIVKFMSEKLISLVQKNILQYSMVHKLLYDFLAIADKAHRTEIIESLQEEIPHLVHTRNGSRVAMKCLWLGTAKERKAIVKSLKPHVVKLCQEEFGHFVMLALLDCVDDTKIVQKALLDELMKNLTELSDNQYGRKVLLYLLAPRDQLFFHPDVVKILSEGDGNECSKKEAPVRRRELLNHVSGPMLKWATDKMKDFKDNSMLLFLGTILTHCTGDASGAMKALACRVVEPFVNSPNKGFHFIDDASGHLLLKKLLESDVDRKKDDGLALFSKILMEVSSEENIKSWIQCNRGCFVVVKLLEVEIEEVTEKIKRALTNCKSMLKKSDSVGSQILLKKL